MTLDDPALDTLMLPFEQNLLPWPQDGGTLFLRAREGAALHRRPRAGLVCEQSFKPDADALQRAGLALVEPGADRRYPLALLLTPPRREADRARQPREVPTIPDTRPMGKEWVRPSTYGGE